MRSEKEIKNALEFCRDELKSTEKYMGSISGEGSDQVLAEEGDKLMCLEHNPTSPNIL